MAPPGLGSSFTLRLAQSRAQCIWNYAELAREAGGGQRVTAWSTEPKSLELSSATEGSWAGNVEGWALKGLGKPGGRKELAAQSPFPCQTRSVIIDQKIIPPRSLGEGTGIHSTPIVCSGLHYRLSCFLSQKPYECGLIVPAFQQ